ncbi:MAG: 5'-3' exonuclease H3TH domain-containing protein, partial [Gammaproteobacteria bacterium]
PPRWQSRSGMPTHAVAGFASFLADLLLAEPAGDFFVAFDESLGSGWRHRIHPGYKKRRALPDAELAFQLDACREITRRLGLRETASNEFEADDLLASAAAHARAAGNHCTVMSRDKDLGQLLAGPDDRLRESPAAACVDRAGWSALHGIRPEQLPARLALTGDPVDDIPGVPGVGGKTAVWLLGMHDDVEEILADLPGVAASGYRGAARVAENLAMHADGLRLARRLTGLRADALPEPPRVSRETADPAALADYCAELGFAERQRARLLRALASAA